MSEPWKFGTIVERRHQPTWRAMVIDGGTDLDLTYSDAWLISLSGPYVEEDDGFYGWGRVWQWHMGSHDWDVIEVPGEP